MAETPIRKTRVDDETWAEFARIARENGETPSSRIRRLIAQDVKENR